jgi:LysM repeat protein
MKLLKSLALMTLLALGTALTLAQPDEIDRALNALGQEIGEPVELNNLTGYEWQEEVYSSTALGCPAEGQSYEQRAVRGYQFLLEFNGTVYDYRVSQESDAVILCSIEDVQPPENPDEAPLADPLQPCDGEVTVNEGDTLYQIARRCNVSVGELVEANQTIQNRAEILYPGEELVIPGTNLAPGETAQPPASPGDAPTPLPTPFLPDEVEPVVAIYPAYGVPGTTITVIANDLPPNTPIEIGLGRPSSQYDILKTEQSGANGALMTELTIPAPSDPGELWIAVVRVEGETEEYASDVFQSVER